MIKPLLILISIMAFNQSVFAKADIREQSIKALQVQATNFDLSVKEWQTYQKLLKGRAKFDYAEKHPLFVLAVYAKTPADTQKYIAKYAAYESKRVARLQELNELFYYEQLKLHGNDAPISLRKLERIRQNAHLILKQHVPNNKNRMLYFINQIKCTDSCKQSLKKALDQLEGSDQTLELFFSAGLSKKMIQQWLFSAGLELDYLLKRKIIIKQAALGDPFWLNRKPNTVYSIPQQ